MFILGRMEHMSNLIGFPSRNQKWSTHHLYNLQKTQFFPHQPLRKSVNPLNERIFNEPAKMIGSRIRGFVQSEAYLRQKWNHRRDEKLLAAYIILKH